MAARGREAVAALGDDPAAGVEASSTSLVSLVLERSAALQRLEGLVLVDPPVAVPDVHEAMYWNPRHSDDPGHRWLRDQVAAAAATVTATGPAPGRDRD